MADHSGAMRLKRASSPILAALLGGLLLAGCADDTAATTTAAAPPHPRIPIQRFLPDNAPPPGTALVPAAPGGTAPSPASPQGTGTTGNAASAGAGGDTTPEPTRMNDPSAPLDTPLCGRAARETIAVGAAISPGVIPAAGACAETACFDPLTDTYIGADGWRHVCQE